MNETAASDKVDSDKQEVIPPTNAQSADSKMHGAISKDPNPTSVDKSSLKKLLLSSTLKCLMVFERRRLLEERNAEPAGLPAL